MTVSVSCSHRVTKSGLFNCSLIPLIRSRMNWKRNFEKEGDDAILQTWWVSCWPLSWNSLAVFTTLASLSLTASMFFSLPFRNTFFNIWAFESTVSQPLVWILPVLEQWWWVGHPLWLEVAAETGRCLEWWLPSSPGQDCEKSWFLRIEGNKSDFGLLGLFWKIVDHFDNYDSLKLSRTVQNSP